MITCIFQRIKEHQNLCATIWFMVKLNGNKRHRIGKRERKKHSCEEHHHSHTYKQHTFPQKTLAKNDVILKKQDQVGQYSHWGACQEPKFFWTSTELKISSINHKNPKISRKMISGQYRRGAPSILECEEVLQNDSAPPLHLTQYGTISPFVVQSI